MSAAAVGAVDRPRGAEMAAVARRNYEPASWTVPACPSNGPLTAMVEELVFGLVGPGGVTVLKDRSPRGDFLLRPNGRGSCEKTAGRLATDLAHRKAVDAAVAVDDRVFLRLTDDAVLAALERPGWGDPFPNGTTTGQRLALLFSCPNANKPLHLGHLRQNAVGMALHRLLLAARHEAIAASLNGDWGVHIAQTLVGSAHVAPDNARFFIDKGDHVAGASIAAYYEQLQADSTIEAEARALLVDLHAGADGPMARWRQLTTDVMAGHATTYRLIGTELAYEAYESRELARALRLVARGQAEGVFRRRLDGSIAADLCDDGLWDVTLVRADGTTTCYPQHLAGWDAVYEELQPDAMLVLIGPDLLPMSRTWVAIARKLRLPWADRFLPFSHGLVRSVEGRLRSRYGQPLTVDAVTETAAARCPTAGLPATSASSLLKYSFLRQPRAKDATYDDRLLWTTTAPRFAALRDAVLTAEGAAQASSPVGGLRTRSTQAARDVVLCLDDLPLATARSLAELDPVFLVRHLERLVNTTLTCAGSANAPADLWSPVLDVLRTTLRLLNLSLEAT